MEVTTARRSPTRPVDLWKWALGALPISAALYAWSPTPDTGRVVFGVTGAATFTATALAPHRCRVKFWWPWALMAAGALCYTVGIVLRPDTEARTGPTGHLASAALAMSWHALAVTALVFLSLHAWRGHQMRYVSLDALMVGLGTGTVGLAVLALPASQVPGPWWRTAMATAYPVVDVLALLSILALGFSTAVHLTASRILMGAVAAMAIADISHSYLAVEGPPVTSALMDLPKLVMLGLVGVAALHPSVAGFNDVRVQPVPVWGRSRLAVIGAAAALPAAGTLIPHHDVPGGHLALAVGAAGVALALLWRAVAAVNSQADIQADLEHRATHDPLTRLGNRDLLAAEVTSMLARPEPEQTVSVIYVDVDGFRFVNESNGHAVGDEVLREAGRRIAAVIATEAAPGGIATRIGGDEFAIALYDDSEGSVGEQVAAACVAAFDTPLRLSVGRFDASVSVGMSNSAPLTDPRFEELLRDADASLYEAKARGCGTWVRLDGRHATLAPQRVGMEHALRRGVEAGRFTARYAPVVNLRSRRRAAVECGFVWADPQYASLPAEAVAAMAEELGLIDTITLGLFADVTEQMTRVAEAEFCVRVPGQLLHSETFAAHLRQLLTARHLDPARLCLLVSEATLSSGQPAVAATIHELRAIGTKFGVHEFGAGPGTLEALRLLPPDGVWVARALVDRLGRPGTEQVMRAAVAVADTYGVAVTAPGVETPEQEEALARCGVRLATGKLLGRPSSNPQA